MRQLAQRGRLDVNAVLAQDAGKRRPMARIHVGMREAGDRLVRANDVTGLALQPFEGLERRALCKIVS